jgi:DNA-binding transcriptional ArsR family regulator
MDVLPTAGDPLVERAADTVTRARGGLPNRIGIIAAPPGFGKTSLLIAAAELAAHRLATRTIWINGSVVASEQHLARLLAPGITLPNTSAALSTSAAEKDAADDRLLIAIDDIDALVFKREGIATLIGHLLVRNREARLLASCHPAAAERFLSPPGWLSMVSSLMSAPIPIVSVGPLDDDAALALVRRREPGLTDHAARAILVAAGGHPAALVFLSRLAVLRVGEAVRPTLHYDAPPGERRTNGEPDGIAGLVDWAAEFAGAVYAEAWAALGPQQRAILWQLARREVPTSASDVASAIDLTASHVSAQLTRLGGDGLVRRTSIRGQFTVAPLLARWIARRAARDEPNVTLRASNKADDERRPPRETAAFEKRLKRPAHEPALAGRNMTQKPQLQQPVSVRPRRGSK